MIVSINRDLAEQYRWEVTPMFYIILKGCPEPIICNTWHDLLLTLGELQRLDLETEDYGQKN